MSPPVPWGTDPPQGRCYILEIAECYAEGGTPDSPATSFRLGGTMPHDSRHRRAFLLALLEAAQTALDELDRDGPPDFGPSHPWHPSRFDRR